MQIAAAASAVNVLCIVWSGDRFWMHLMDLMNWHVFQLWEYIYTYVSYGMRDSCCVEWSELGRRGTGRVLVLLDALAKCLLGVLIDWFSCIS